MNDLKELLVGLLYNEKGKISKSKLGGMIICIGILLEGYGMIDPIVANTIKTFGAYIGGTGIRDAIKK